MKATLRAARLSAVLTLALVAVQHIAYCQTVTRGTNILATPVAKRLNYHTSPAWTRNAFRDQHQVEIPSLLHFDDGSEIKISEEWYQKRRPELISYWTKLLGKLGPDEDDLRWFGDIRQAVIHDRQEKDGYTRIHLSLPMETDFQQPHLLLLPKNQGAGPFPAVIAWTSSSPDYTQPETWWGAWLAQRGYVVLCGWSFIRNYRNGTDYSSNVNEQVYARFDHWLPMAKMVHDVQREVEFLRSLSEVDDRRIGFMGFSLSAKAALYVAAFAPEIHATVAIDPHVAVHGATNYHDPWYLDWQRVFEDIDTPEYPIRELRRTVWSLLDADPDRPGFERNHHELMALCAPRAFLLIGCSVGKLSASHSDDAQSWGYFNRAKEVYDFLEIPERISFVATDVGHRAADPEFDAAWQSFFERWLKSDMLVDRENQTTE